MPAWGRSPNCGAIESTDTKARENIDKSAGSNLVATDLPGDRKARPQSVDERSRRGTADNGCAGNAQSCRLASESPVHRVTAASPHVLFRM